MLSFHRCLVGLLLVLAFSASPTIGQAADATAVTMYRMLDALSETLGDQCFNLERSGESSDSANARSLKMLKIMVDHERWHQLSLMTDDQVKLVLPTDSSFAQKSRQDRVRQAHDVMRLEMDLLLVYLTEDTMARKIQD